MSAETKSTPLERLTPDSQALSWLWSVPRRPRSHSLLIVLSFIAGIGCLDYVTGIWVSLQFFYLVPILLSVIWLDWRVGCATAALCVATRLGTDIAAGVFAHINPIAVYWNRLVDLGGSFLLIGVVHSLVTLQRQLDRHVRERTAALEQAIFARNQLQNQLFEISRRERSTIGHDLHDGLGQHLTAISMAAELLASRLATDRHPSAADAQNLVRMMQDSIAQTRRIARGLLLAEIEPEQLVPELEELAASLTREPGLNCRFVSRGNLQMTDSTTASHLFYIAREAVHNALRHAHATQLDLSLVADDTTLLLTVSDNGRGLPSPNAAKSGLGLRIMAHRSELIGAEFSIEAAPTAGTVMRCRVPLIQLPTPVTLVGDRGL